MRPVLIVNFKTYLEATGNRALRLARACEDAAVRYNVDVRVAVQALDLAAIAQAVKIPVYSEAVDPVRPGQHTGAITAAAIRAEGGRGAILNHSERYMSTAMVEEAARFLGEERLDVCVCAESLARLAELSGRVAPDFFCIEPPELIGGDVSVSTARPDLVKRAVQVSTRPLLIGAGVRHYEDYRLALELGCAGVLVSSGIAKAEHPEKALRELLTPHGR